MKDKIRRSLVCGSIVAAGVVFGSAGPVAADASQDNFCELGRVCLYNERDRSNGVAEYVWDDWGYGNNTFNHSSCGIFGWECSLNDETAFLKNNGANNDVCHYEDSQFEGFRFKSKRGDDWNTAKGLSSHKWINPGKSCPS